ncbi:uncharacterized protein LOC142956671 [Anarhichas minor]|uniref:uncharacterized protein LOC142956671 n=1 Tax=Anarhichas minor TaxID=65739 RepID=UPI003F73F1CE
MLSIELRGDSSGYIALGLTANASEGTTMLFICAQNSLTNGSFFFRTMTMNNTDRTLSGNEELVSDIRGMVNGTVIKCEFNITSVNATRTRSSPVTTASILLGSGTTTGTTIGTFELALDSGPLNLADLVSNTTAAPTSNTTAAPTSNTTAAPTSNTTAAPTSNTTAAPTVSTTAAPTVSTTAAPTVSTTAAPTVSTTAAPTVSVTAAPTVIVTAAPTVIVTAAPTVSTTMPNSGGAVQPHAVLLLLSVLSLAVMLRA